MYITFFFLFFLILLPPPRLVLELVAGASVTKNCLSQFLEQTRTGSHSAVTNLYKNIPEHSDPYVITQIRNCVKLLNLVANRSF